MKKPKDLRINLTGECAQRAAAVVNDIAGKVKPCASRRATRRAKQSKTRRKAA